MGKFLPNDEDMKRTVAALGRSEKKYRRWRLDGEFYNALYVNDLKAFNEDAPGGNIGAGRTQTASVVRNGIHFAVWAAVRRKQIKNPRFEAIPLLSGIAVEMPDGSKVEVEASQAAYAQGEILTYMARRKNLEENLIGTLEQGEIWDEGWLKLVTWDGADAPETVVWVDSGGEDAPDGSSARKIKTRRPANSLANDRLPSAIFVSNEYVIPDADARCDAEMNRITHRCVKPLSQMKSAQIDDYEMYLDKEGRLKSRPSFDPETGQPKKRARYRNLDGLSGNYNFYLDRQSGKIGARDGDVRAYRNDQTDQEPSDYLAFYEEHGRFPADSAIVENEFGAIPKTIDGFVYYIKSYVENTSPGARSSGPTLIRFDWYPVDLGMFALVRYNPFPKAGSLRGFSWIRNAHEALSMENYWASYKANWYASFKPTTIWNRNLIDPETVKKIQSGDHFDNVLCDVPLGQQIQNAYSITQFPEAPQGVDLELARMRSIQDEASGASSNQRLQSESGVSATQSGIIDANAQGQNTFDVSRVKAFLEKVGRGLMRLLRATLPATGRFQVPGSDGAFVDLDVAMLDLECSYTLSYESFDQPPNPVETKQLAEFTAKIAGTPPQLWPTMMPLWEAESARFSPGVMAAFRKFVKVALEQKPETDPDREHLAMREGVKVEPDPNENFVETIPKHRKMRLEIFDEKSPLYQGWNRKLPEGGVTPAQLLSYHLAASAKIAVAKGLGPALGLLPDQAGMQRKERGSGPESGRLSQDASPSEGKIEAGANSMEM